VQEFALIGSALREDFRPDSDVDVVVTFAPEAEWDLFDIVRMREELARIFGRDVDLIEEPAVRNPYMRASIRRTKRVLHAA
jgi:predicted nucleotidyltransferase